MKTYRVSDNPPLNMTQSALDYMRQTLAVAPGEKENIILVIEWASNMKKRPGSPSANIFELRIFGDMIPIA